MSENFNNEENQNNSEHSEKKEKKYELPWHNGNGKTLKFLAICLSAFLGGFAGILALGGIYTVSHKNPQLYRPLPPVMDSRVVMPDEIFDDMRPDMDDDTNMAATKPPVPVRMHQTVSVEENLENYKIYIDLRRFNNNDKNINLLIKPHTVKITGKAEIKNPNEQSSFNFSQNLTLERKIDVGDVSKQVMGHKLIVTLPIED